jgi:hypothetical protein
MQGTERCGPFSVDQISELYLSKKIDPNDELFLLDNKTKTTAMSVLDLTRTAFDPKTGLLNAFLAIRKSEDNTKFDLTHTLWKIDERTVKAYIDFLGVKILFLSLLCLASCALGALWYYSKNLPHPPAINKKSIPPKEQPLEEKKSPILKTDPIIKALPERNNLFTQPFKEEEKPAEKTEVDERYLEDQQEEQRSLASEEVEEIPAEGPASLIPENSEEQKDSEKKQRHF